MTQTDERDALLAFANEMADRAANIAMRHFKNNVSFEYKSDETPVTIADQEIERALREMIADSYPAHAVVGEEEGGGRPDSENIWVIDPIDGTKSFLAGVPLFGCLLALLVRGKPILGVLETPALAERWIGIEGAPTMFNGSPCETGSSTDVTEAIMFTTSPDMFTPDEQSRYQPLYEKVRYVRHGADCYSYGLLASGYADLVVESDLKPYDYLALVAVVEQAGGVITDWQGQALTLHSGTSTVIAAATPDLHQEALAILAQQST